MNVLVVGGAGFIGAHTCKALHQAGHIPVVYDNLSTGHSESVRWGPLEVGDIRDSGRLAEVMLRYEVDVVLHFAALAYVGESVTDPAKYYNVNIGGSIAVLDAMRSAGVGSIIFSSTCATYGIPDALPISETALQRPINPYGFTKLAIEQAIADYGRAYGVSWIVLRYFNAAGADPEGELGERHDPETHAIPLAIRSALLGDRSFTVYGTDYPTRDGSAVRDYIHVADLADAHVKAVSAVSPGSAGTAFNLGTGNGVTVLEMIRAVEKATGRPVNAVLGPRRPGDPPALWTTPEKAKIELAWNPSFTDIDDIVQSAVAWFSRNGFG